MSEAETPRGFGSPRAACLTGAKAVGLFLFGTIPFGLGTGIATKAAGLTPWEAVAMTVMVYMGAVRGDW